MWISGENQNDPEANKTLVPIHIVTHASQLPKMLRTNRSFTILVESEIVWQWRMC